MPPRLFLNYIADLDWLIALEFGRVDDGQPDELWAGVSERMGFLHREVVAGIPTDPVGFKVLEFSKFDVDTEEHAELWNGPRFDVPVLGLTDVAPNHIVLAARALFDGRQTVNATS